MVMITSDNNIFIVIRKSLRLINEQSKWFLVVNAAVVLIQGVLPTITIMITQHLINLIQLNQVDFEIIICQISLLVAFQLFNSLLLYCSSKYNNNFRLQFSKHLKERMLAKSMELSISDYENADTYDTITKAQRQDGSAIISFVLSIFDVVQQMVSAVIMISLITKYKWQFVPLIVGLSFLRSMVTYKNDQKNFIVRNNRATLDRKQWYINYLCTTGKAFKEIKVFGMKEYLLGKYDRNQKTVISQEKEIFKRSSLCALLFDSLEWIVTGGIYVCITFAGYCRRILLGDVVAYIDYASQIRDSVNQIFVLINGLLDDTLYLDWIFQYLELPTSGDEGNYNLEKISSVEFRHVCFGFSDDAVINNISFKIPEGKCVAVIGENGSGKSTLIKLLLGLYSNYEGEILINGIDIRNINKEHLYKRIGVVFQEYMKYETTIRENVAYGNLNSLMDEEKILDSLSKVKLVNKIPNADIDAIIGSWFGEYQLSVGEWQRLAIARSLLKNADLYIFDEPEAGIDIWGFGNLIKIFKDICKENGIDMQVTMLTKGGMGFDYHVENEQTKFNILYGDYDFIILIRKKQILVTVILNVYTINRS